ncbi:MAG: bifunctional diaminohydroxyphosphoribosylaminopyrimidine deaminase/5-amino-6-(5-phosphoribosylamino)uracil reductase RibD [Nitrosomonas sp.]|nr:bifunctional diaminohydroxyphosphoribosylaminopyrimidine deaminase/5-amino-6-(5-phosphoribosylamino)uracil reductase RibD [Nitrosomonas sp.]
MFTTSDHVFMSQALQLAEKGLYTTSPNPRVGCVITRNNQVVGNGWHEAAGQPHAEINALAMTGEMARGATAYVTLEPCNHHGRTPPCVNALIQAGITRVLVAMEDPNPLVRGGGIEALRQAGVLVQSGLMQHQAEVLNAGFVKRMRQKKPWVRLKMAASLDGKTALKNGQSQWITGEAARRDGHHWRARSCAVLTGIGTVIADNPQLTVRHVPTSRQPRKVIIDNRLAIPLDTDVLSGETVYIFTTSTEKMEKIDKLEKMGVNVIPIEQSDQGRVNLVDVMTTLAQLECNEILVEAGSILNGALIQAGLVDELIIYIAPSLLGSNARDMFQLPELSSLDQKFTLKIDDVRMIGQDIRVIAHL